MLSLENISKSFGEKQVLNSIDMTIESGSPVALIGPNGAGKTTLFSIIAGFMKADRGVIKYNNIKLPDASQFGQLAVLPQDAQLDPRFTIEKQLRFFARLQGLTTKASRHEVSRILELVGMEGERRKKPLELSHGMRKRVCISQALIGRPSLVLLDEATAGLDPLHARSIRELISGLTDDVTFILSSHDLSELERLCERVFVFSGGKLTQYLNVNDASLDNVATTKNTDFLTLRMRSQLSDEIVTAIDNMVDVHAITATQNREYLVEYFTSDESFDVKLLKFLREQGYEYQQLYNGKTLENQLFLDE